MYLLDNILLFKGYPLRKAKTYFSRIKNLKPNEFSNWQENKKWQIFRHHYDLNSFYSQFIGSSLPKNWEDIPIIKKSDFQKSLDEILSCSNKRNLYISSTSGSSGHPLYFAKDKFSHAMTYALIKDRYKELGVSLNMKQARFYGIPKYGYSRIIEKLKDILSNRTRFSVFDLSDEKMSENIDKFQKEKFELIYGYTSAIIIFAKFLLKKNIKLSQICNTIKACIVTSEMCSSEDELILSKAFNIPIFQEYGASEIDVIALKSNDHWKVSDENVLIEVVNEHGQVVKNGESGKLILTSLHNKAMPFVRYEIGDFGSIERNGRTTLISLEGRTSDIIRLPNGKIAGAMTFYYASRSILEETGLLKEFVVRQKLINRFDLEVVAYRELKPEEFKYLERTIKDYLGENIEVHIHQVNKLVRSSSGKIKHFYSEL